MRSRQSDHGGGRHFIASRSPKENDFFSDGVSYGHQKPRNRQKHQAFPLARSTASLDCKQTQSQLQRRRLATIESGMESRKSQQLQTLEFDSEPTYYRQVLLSFIVNLFFFCSLVKRRYMKARFLRFLRFLRFSFRTPNRAYPRIPKFSARTVRKKVKFARHRLKNR